MLSTYHRIIMAEIAPTATMIPVTREKTRTASAVILLDCPPSILLDFFVCISEEKKYTVIIMFKFSNEFHLMDRTKKEQVLIICSLTSLTTSRLLLNQQKLE